jgi:hypothetical protein
VLALFGAFPLWWALGLSSVIWILLALPILVRLLARGGVRVPRGCRVPRGSAVAGLPVLDRGVGHPAGCGPACRQWPPRAGCSVPWPTGPRPGPAQPQAGGAAHRRRRPAGGLPESGLERPDPAPGRAEADMLRRLAGAGRRGFVAPDLLHQGTWRGLDITISSALPHRTWRHRRRHALPPVAVSREIAALGGVEEAALGDGGWWVGLRPGWPRSARPWPAHGATAPPGGGGAGPPSTPSWSGWRGRARTRLVFGTWHGDWAPWNLRSIPGAAGVGPGSAAATACPSASTCSTSASRPPSRRRASPRPRRPPAPATWRRRMVARHPAVVSLSTRKWARLRSLDALLDHWFAAHRLLEQDAPFLRRLLVLKYEHLVADPEGDSDPDRRLPRARGPHPGWRHRHRPQRHLRAPVGPPGHRHRPLGPPAVPPAVLPPRAERRPLRRQPARPGPRRPVPGRLARRPLTGGPPYPLRPSPTHALYLADLP